MTEHYFSSLNTPINERKFYLDLKGQSVELTNGQPEGWLDHFGIEVRRVSEEGTFRVKRVIISVTEQGCGITLLGQDATTWVILGCLELPPPKEGSPWHIPDLPTPLSDAQKHANAWLQAKSVEGVSPEELANFQAKFRALQVNRSEKP